MIPTPASTDMLWPLLVEYTEPGLPASSSLQQQGNMALFLTLFIVTCVEVLIVKVAQSERELENMLMPHDPSYQSGNADDDDEVDNDDGDIWHAEEVDARKGLALFVGQTGGGPSRVRSSLYEEEVTRRKRFLVDGSYLLDSPEFQETRRVENGFKSRFVRNSDRSLRSDELESALLKSERSAEKNDRENQDPDSDTVRIRELMEKMVETMIGGPLDGTTVGQLSSHSACRNADSPEVKISSLKLLIREIINQAMALPDLKNFQCLSKTPKEPTAEEFDGKSYEDILATAILNKIVENFQSYSHKKGDSSLENPKPRVRRRRARRNDGTDDLKSEGDWSDTSRSDQLSLTIEEYIEEVTTAVEVTEDDVSELSDLETSTSRRVPFPELGRTVVDGTDPENSDTEEQSTATELITSTSSWEENWLFQKKRLRSTPNAHHPVPVPMLVPNPSEDFKALVGGVDADDLSDMSECSDSVLEELVTAELKPTGVSEAEVEAQQRSIESNEGFEEEFEKRKSEKIKVILTHITEESFYEKLRNRGELDDTKNFSDAEEEDKLGLRGAVEKVSRKFSEYERQPPQKGLSREVTSATGNHFSSLSSVLMPMTPDGEDSLIRCRVAEREKEKWMNPVLLTDNPYCPENIEKKAQQLKRNEYFRIGTYTGESIDFPDEMTSSVEPFKTTAESSRFTRDYHANAIKHPSDASSPSSEQVSRHPYEVFSQQDSEAWRKYRTSSASHRPSPVQTIAGRHFSQVFKTSASATEDSLKTQIPRRQRYSSQTLKLRPSSKVTLHGKASLQRELSSFEQKSLRENLSHAFLRAKGSSSFFTLNPVFGADPDVSFSSLPYDVNCEHARATSTRSQRGGRTSQESGYGSDSLDHSSDSLEFWRLTPPKTPEVVESSLVSILGCRRAKGKRKCLSDIF